MMLGAMPLPLVGEDAVQYFHDHSRNQGRDGLFLHCNLANRSPSEYQPYDLLVVPQSAAEPEHCIISSTGVCYIFEHSTAVTPLHTWLKESRQFRLLRKLTYFKKFLMVKAFVKWHVQHKQEKFWRRGQALLQNLPMLNPVFSGCVRAICTALGVVNSGATGVWEKTGEHSPLEHV